MPSPTDVATAIDVYTRSDAYSSTFSSLDPDLNTLVGKALHLQVKVLVTANVGQAVHEAVLADG